MGRRDLVQAFDIDLVSRNEKTQVATYHSSSMIVKVAVEGIAGIMRCT